ncbi:hypothetical protein PV04_06887 [Phialophora macrospora]|uniref:JmjC domain-containing protein n=1 Tax=Phialophora macrospora TaxID=1851006 RepID=A0A0D2CR73_9EURO|nr:hypothetical protein PV04_06887 [Phialophora macrospora]
MLSAGARGWNPAPGKCNRAFVTASETLLATRPFMPCLVTFTTSSRALACARAHVRRYSITISPSVSVSIGRLVLPSWSSARQLTTSTAVGKGHEPGPGPVAAGPLRNVPVLRSWESHAFEQAFRENVPVRLSRSREHLPPACLKWFVHDDNPEFDLFGKRQRQASPNTELLNTNTNTDIDIDASGINLPRSSELRTSFWSGYESTVVALEVTNDGHFERLEAPIQILLAYLSKAQSPPSSSPSPSPSLPPEGPEPEPAPRLSIYLAQSDLSTLPPPLQADVPTPTLLRSSPPSSGSGSRSRSRSIKGDIYASSLWMGRPPTYTPLHRDPNPNLFIQLAGQKTIRLLPPDIGDAIYGDVMMATAPGGADSSPSSFSSRIRGEEMMVGPERNLLHDGIWDADHSGRYADLLRTHCLETTLGLGDALFTPKGWWHSVKGVGTGVTASVNWWFR